MLQKRVEFTHVIKVSGVVHNWVSATLIFDTSFEIEVLDLNDVRISLVFAKKLDFIEKMLKTKEGRMFFQNFDRYEFLFPLIEGQFYPSKSALFYCK